jgi:hypothetical protein
MVPIPDNLALLVGLPSPQADVIERILKGQTDLKTNLLDLSKFWKIKVWFNQPTEIHTIPQWVTSIDAEGKVWKSRTRSKTDTVHVIARFFQTDWEKLCYLPRRNVRRGFHFPELDTVVKYEPVIEDNKDKFSSYEKFAAKFDRRFMPESEIQSLWNSRSGQHGGQYKPSDFHRIGPQGKRVLSNFLRLFVDWNTEGKCYIEHKYDDGKITKTLSERHKTYHRLGRDITIEHTLGIPRVFYSSEYQGCGNGRYGLLANKNEFLWLEDD